MKPQWHSFRLARFRLCLKVMDLHRPCGGQYFSVSDTFSNKVTKRYLRTVLQYTISSSLYSASAHELT